MTQESPEYLRTSTAAAMTLKLKRGRFYRNARLGCINLLLEYNTGCSASCAYCGLSRNRPGRYSEKSFIRVQWPLFSTETIINQINKHEKKLRRICISMITHVRAARDTVTLCKRFKSQTNLPISLLVCPTVIDIDILNSFYRAGADRIGIAVDAATPELFNIHRGAGVNGPHHWARYWKCFSESVSIFGKNQVGSHLMVGIGETEQQMVQAIWKTRQTGGFTHLFSFYPEPNSGLSQHAPPPIESYRKIQLARYLIDTGRVSLHEFSFNDDGNLISFGLPKDQLLKIASTGTPFETSGCPGHDGHVACNRPFANSLPGPDVRNLPYQANQEDLDRIFKQLGF